MTWNPLLRSWIDSTSDDPPEGYSHRYRGWTKRTKSASKILARAKVAKDFRSYASNDAMYADGWRSGWASTDTGSIPSSYILQGNGLLMGPGAGGTDDAILLPVGVGEASTIMMLASRLQAFEGDAIQSDGAFVHMWRDTPGWWSGCQLGVNSTGYYVGSENQNVAPRWVQSHPRPIIIDWCVVGVAAAPQRGIYRVSVSGAHNYTMTGTTVVNWPCNFQAVYVYGASPEGSDNQSSVVQRFGVWDELLQVSDMHEVAEKWLAEL